MLTDPRGLDAFSYGELNTLRLEAMSLFERCFRDGTPDKLLAFIETQIAQEPPPIQLLREIAEDMHRRLQSLRRLQYELRVHTIHTLQHDFGVDLSRLFPLNGFDPRLTVDVIIAGLVPDGAPDEVSLRHTLETAYESAARVTDDILMVEGLHKCLIDWADALSARIARESWIEGRFSTPDSKLQ